MAASGDSRDLETMDKLLECPVCYGLLKQPKQLGCGHCVCDYCARFLETVTYTNGTSEATCPVCRASSLVPPDGLPTNFPLANLVGQILKDKEKRCHTCALCNESNVSAKMFICNQCDCACLCGVCVAKLHSHHYFVSLDEHIKTQYEQIEQWTKHRLSPVLKTHNRECRASSKVSLGVQRQCDKLKQLVDRINHLSVHNSGDVVAKTQQYEQKINRLRDSNGNNMNAGNGYKFDFLSLEQEFEGIVAEHKKIVRENGFSEALGDIAVKLKEVEAKYKTGQNSAISGGARRKIAQRRRAPSSQTIVENQPPFVADLEMIVNALPPIYYYPQPDS